MGNFLDVVLTNISPVGNWVADFFEATGTTVLSSGFTQTPRPLRLWAADLGAFGINASNIASIAYFKVTLSGDSDFAFVAYNTTTINVSSTLDLASDVARTARLTRSRTTDEKKTFSVYPNPARAFVNVDHAAATGTERVLVYNMQGVLLSEAAVSRGSTTTRLNIPSLRPGSYQVVYINDNTKVSSMLVVEAEKNLVSRRKLMA